jgi:hypothetical protein
VAFLSGSSVTLEPLLSTRLSLVLERTFGNSFMLCQQVVGHLELWQILYSFTEK